MSPIIRDWIDPQDLEYGAIKYDNVALYLRSIGCSRNRNSKVGHQKQLRRGKKDRS